MVKLTIIDRWVVACMTCHGQLGTEVDTYEQAMKECRIHLSITEKPHNNHTMTVTPTKIIRKAQTMGNQQKPVQPKCVAIIDGIADVSPFPYGETEAAHPTPACGAFVSVETSAPKIDKEFEGMATDEVYQREAIELLGEDAANTKSAGGLLGSSVATSSPEAAPLSGEGVATAQAITKYFANSYGELGVVYNRSDVEEVLRLLRGGSPVQPTALTHSYSDLGGYEPYDE